ncbi:ANTAR domain-containing protein [Clavibacter sepedonicus]|nr:MULTISPECIES: ANTAR domain-containing protein [Clavibacter]MBD5383021.1 ANTAR domain-containing protein [Clavibacter sp.]OQJ49624.1 histidine kinase [Clavibacter sepedonicus]OQJ55420.1 histidine kinase [Clavibacter sepedonicus]UUK65252.1 ANTAR domain-containing protein [Clavibacter sepedonicus]
MEQHRSALPVRVVAAFHAAPSRAAGVELLLSALLEASSATGAAVILPRASEIVVAGESGAELRAVLEADPVPVGSRLLVVAMADGAGKRPDARRDAGGAVALHRATGSLDAADRVVAEEVAVHARIALAAWDAADDLAVGLASRSVIGQAQGILMERFSLDADRAFQVLRRYSQDGNVKLVEVARGIVETGALPGG